MQNGREKKDEMKTDKQMSSLIDSFTRETVSV